MSAPITVSYVVTVYNKAAYVADTLRSLLTQQGDFTAEYVLVDDCSTDDSLAVVERATQGVPNVVIIKNSDNRGPSIRLNQGIRIAQGEFVQCMDSDDILAANATRTMLGLLKEHQADFIYGSWEKTGLPGAELLGRTIPQPYRVQVSDAPLESVLRGRFIRMTFLARRALLLAAGGADEQVFIQDESLPLRMAAVAKRFVSLGAPVMFVPKVEGELSGNKSQLNHDRFLAHANLLDAHRERLSGRVSRALFARCVSAGWKQTRQELGVVRGLGSHMFWHYAWTKLRQPAPKPEMLNHLRARFAATPGVRRVQ